MFSFAENGHFYVYIEQNFTHFWHFRSYKGAYFSYAMTNVNVKWRMIFMISKSSNPRNFQMALNYLVITRLLITLVKQIEYQYIVFDVIRQNRDCKDNE